MYWMSSLGAGFWSYASDDHPTCINEQMVLITSQMPLNLVTSSSIWLHSQKVYKSSPILFMLDH